MDRHTCSKVYKVLLLNSKWLCKKIQINVRDNQNLKLTNIMEMARQK